MKTEQTIKCWKLLSGGIFVHAAYKHTHLIVYTYTNVVSKYPRHGSYTFEYVMIVTIYM